MVPANLQGNLTKMLRGYLRWTSIPSKEIAILLVPYAIETGVKRLPDKPLTEDLS